MPTAEAELGLPEVEVEGSAGDPPAGTQSVH